MSPTPDNVSRIGLAAPTSLDDVPGEPWEPPVPLSDDAASLPRWPLECLPEPARSLVQAGGESLDMDDPALLALLVFPTASTVTAGRWIAHPWGSWREALQMFTCGVAPPSAGKTPAHGIVVGPLHELESELQKRHEDEAGLLASKRRTDEKRLQNLENLLAKEPADVASARERDELAHYIATNPLPPFPRLITTDSSPERLVSLMAEQGGRIAQIDDEAGPFGMMAGRYSESALTTNLDPWTKGYPGTTPLTNDRQGRAAVIVPRPTLTVGLSVQPGALRDAGRNAHAVARGIMARFLYAWPNLSTWIRRPDAPEVPELVAARWGSRLRELHAVSEEIDPADPRVLEFTPEAVDVLSAWCAECGRMRSTLELERGNADPFAQWLGKLEGNTVRIAGNLALLADPHARVVDAQVVERAVELARGYFLPHARRVFGEFVQDDDTRRAARILDAIRKGDPSRFEGWPHLVTMRELHRAVRGTTSLELDKAENVRQGVSVLTERGYLRPAPVVAGEPRGSGRPAERYELSPYLFDEPPADTPAPVVEMPPPPARKRRDKPEPSTPSSRDAARGAALLSGEPGDEPGLFDEDDPYY